MITPATDNQKIIRRNQQQNLIVERNQAWLEQQLALIWQTHFTDVVQNNTVTIVWGKASRTRLGSIKGRGGVNPKNNPQTSLITINRLLQNPLVPQCVIWQTIAHELAHYTHGFCSPHSQKYAHPHRGDVVTKELTARGLAQEHAEAQTWLKTQWHPFVTQNLGKNSRKRSINATRNRFKLSFLPHFTARTIRRRGLGR